MHRELLVCPDCDSEPLDVVLEDGQLVFSCENCGWAKTENRYFYLTGWNVEIRQALAPVDVLQSLLASSDVVEFLQPRLAGISYLSAYKDASREYLQAEIDDIYQIYLRQMVVLAVTYVELLLKDFYQHLFIAHPQRMHKYLVLEGRGQAQVSLGEVIGADSKEDLVLALVERATHNAVGARFDKVVERIVKECQLRLDKPLVEDLKDLNGLRNRIVHEGTTEAIEADRIYGSFGLVLYLLYVLGKAAEEYKMVYWDEVGFMNDFEAKLAEVGETAA